MGRYALNTEKRGEFLYRRATYEFLFVYVFGFFGRDPRRYGNGRRYGDDPVAGAGGRRRTKNSAMRQSVFLFAYEPRRIKNACRKRAVKNGRRLVDYFAGGGVVGVGCDGSGGVAVSNVGKGVRRISDCALLVWILSKFAKELIFYTAKGI